MSIGKIGAYYNENRFSYWKDESILNASTEGYNITWTDQLSTGRSYTEGTILKGEQISFIPSQSSVTVSPIKVKSNFFQLPKADKGKEGKLNANGSRLIKHSFLQDNSPLKFPSYLTLSTTEDFNIPITLDNQFWVSEVISHYPSHL
jgi:hypothetical protein